MLFKYIVFISQHNNLISKKHKNIQNTYYYIKLYYNVCIAVIINL